ncbi:MAG: hypothetical protein IRZ28_05355 [Steroidobacteraceae bacterium]|nr:hypothetical protein [Steroidobacteraceae bacterium]
MNTFEHAGLRVAACSVVAVAITLALSWTFVESTAVVRNYAVPGQVLAAADASPTLLAKAGSTGLLQ